MTLFKMPQNTQQKTSSRVAGLSRTFEVAVRMEKVARENQNYLVAMPCLSTKEAEAQICNSQGEFCAPQLLSTASTRTGNIRTPQNSTEQLKTRLS